MSVLFVPSCFALAGCLRDTYPRAGLLPWAIRAVSGSARDFEQNSCAQNVVFYPAIFFTCSWSCSKFSCDLLPLTSHIFLITLKFHPRHGSEQHFAQRDTRDLALLVVNVGPRVVELGPFAAAASITITITTAISITAAATRRHKISQLSAAILSTSRTDLVFLFGGVNIPQDSKSSHPFPPSPSPSSADQIKQRGVQRWKQVKSSQVKSRASGLGTFPR